MKDFTKNLEASLVRTITELTESTDYQSIAKKHGYKQIGGDSSRIAMKHPSGHQVDIYPETGDVTLRAPGAKAIPVRKGHLDAVLKKVHSK